jgi:putative hydrolase of the HAD superfamily
MNTTQKIHAILFDFIGVLMRVKKVPPDSITDEIDRMIGSVTDDKAFKKEAQTKFNLTDIQFEAYLEKIVNRFEPFKPLWDMIPSLNNKYKLAIINNGTAITLPRVFTRFPELTTQFDDFISSAKEGVKKPNQEIYLRACQKLNVKPEECLFMDNDKQNADAASVLGMQTIWWETHEKGFEKFLGFYEKNKH